jgi:hypothetical protein
VSGRRRIWIGVGLGLLVVVVAFAVLIAVAERSDRVDERPATRGSTAPEAPRIIPRPLSGEEPEQSGDRGGWAQLALLAVIVGAVALVAFLAYRSSRRAR